ncbi:hypothetical protein C8Q76DRAFT_634074 [Earliella scabrosa]|nr:hypothetical protein C8Q76DRAFT_634074 [Earliella scabrosa]
MLRAWLNFPSNVQMLAGHFVMYVVGAFKNPDVLLLNGVWKVYPFTHPLGPPAIPAAVPDGPLDRLLAFALHILPIARDRHLSSPSPLQQRVLDRSDHYLPFRELASSRQQVTGPGGPFHPSVRCQSGAFPSWLIFRALMFDSPILHAGRTRCYFPNEAAWNRFLLDEDFNANDKQSVARFFNASCYGTRQQPRTKGNEIARTYFAAEPRWHVLREKYRGGPIPFEIFLNWSRGKHEDGRFSSGKVRYKQVQGAEFTLVGKLTSYLLTADLVYAGLVAPPNVDQVAAVIKANALGSLKALASLKLVEKKTSREEVTDAFRSVYNRLDGGISAADKHFIVFDAIMVEHLLCKYQRSLKYARG